MTLADVAVVGQHKGEVRRRRFAALPEDHHPS